LTFLSEYRNYATADNRLEQYKKVESLVVDRAARCGKLTVPLKQTIRHMRGRNLTKEQSAANDKLSGMNQSFYVNQLITLIESKLLDSEDEQLFERLKHLHGLLEELLVT